MGEPLSSEAEHLERLNGLLGAHRSLFLIAPRPGCLAELLRRPEPAFFGGSILEVMLEQVPVRIARVRARLLGLLKR